ncbi:MAG: hypothetical protein CMJ78_24680 [Planctomycetaceae bacterium]|nr:hypothetical protein [Planctomycetaceae bacterium]
MPKKKAAKKTTTKKKAKKKKTAKPEISMNKLYDQIYDIADNFKSYKQAVTGFDGAPIGFKYIFSIDYVDADIRNGGIYQLHHNSTWHLILDAIEGTKVVGFDKLSETLREILFYYHRNGRSKMKKRIPDNYFDDMPDNWDKDLDKLEGQYYRCFSRLKTDDTRDLWKTVIKKQLELLQ